MPIFAGIAVLTAIGAASGAGLRGQEPTRLSLDLRDMDPERALRALTALSFAVPPRVDGAEVTLELHGVSPDLAIHRILQALAVTAHAILYASDPDGAHRLIVFDSALDRDPAAASSPIAGEPAGERDARIAARDSTVLRSTTLLARLVDPRL